VFEERRDIGVGGKVRQADQQHGDQADPRLWVDEQGRQVADANGLFRHEPRQQEDLRQQHRYAHQRSDQERHAPAHQAAEPGADGHAQTVARVTPTMMIDGLATPTPLGARRPLRAMAVAQNHRC
jgi:hypothetical protein